MLCIKNKIIIPKDKDKKKYEKMYALSYRSETAK